MSEVSRKTMFLVSEDGAWRASISELLQDEGYFVTGSGDGVEVFTHVNGSEPAPSVIVIDGMPPLDGVEFRSAQRWVPSIANVPIAIVTGVAGAEAHARVSFLAPCEGFDLLHLLRSLAPGSYAAAGTAGK
jgi:CheY-like chemotaxis protein